jgi:hypothetical protein
MGKMKDNLQSLQEDPFQIHEKEELADLVPQEPLVVVVGPEIGFV